MKGVSEIVHAQADQLDNDRKQPLNWHNNRTTRSSEQAQTTHRTEGPRTGFPGSDVGLETARVR